MRGKGPLDVISRFYPEKRMSGFCRNDHRVVFFNQVNALLRPNMTVVDFGAGRGKWTERESGYKLEHTTLRGKCRKVIGIDVDEAVLKNPLVDEGMKIGPSDRLPLEDESVDLVVSWAVFEHVSDPAFVVRELQRILKPGGWICAVTPSKWSYFAIMARLVPNRYHARLVTGVLGSRRQGEDVFPTVYRMNTLSALGRHFPSSVFDSFSYYHNGPPAYSGGYAALAWLWRLWMWALPPVFSQQIHVFLRKREAAA